MTFTPPFTLTGEAGKALGNVGYSLAALGVQDAVLSLRSLDVDTLTFSLRDNGNRPAIPDDGQWITLKDDAGQVLFTGIAKRSFRFPERIYTYEISNVYQGMMETPLLGSDGRPFLIYDMDELQDRIRDILTRASNAGLPFQAPSAEDMPTLYLAPKMAFRAASYASALEDVLKWVPDVVSFADYSTSPPTLRFRCRSQSPAATLDLDSDGHKATAIELTALPEARALGVKLAYARRSGDSLILSLEQQAGDFQAETNRSISIFLSGVERTDALVSDALTSAQLALIKINELITVTGAGVDAAAATAALSLDWAACLERDADLQAAAAAQPGFTMGPGGYFSLYSSIGCSGGASGNLNSYNTGGLYLGNANATAATGWYAIKPDAFTTAQLNTAGATKATRYISGKLLTYRVALASNTGMNVLQTNQPTKCQAYTGWTQGYTFYCADEADYYRKYLSYTAFYPVDAINMSPSAVAAAVKAAAAGTQASGFIERAEFVEAPPDLAANYFARQDWTPYKGSLTLAPTAPDFPAPGDFLSVRGEGLPAEWATMKVPVAELALDLRTGAATVAIGPSPRMDFSSLVDRLRIPPEDNYQAG
jgi:hypothetical protein